MEASVPAVQKGSGSGYATVAGAEEENSGATMADVLWAGGGSSKQAPPEGSILHVTDLPIKKRIQLINLQEAAAAAEIQPETKRIQLTSQDQTAKTPPVCDVCNRTFASSRSVAIHKGHHIRRDRARVQEQAAPAPVEKNPCNNGLSQRRQAVAKGRRRSNGPGVVHECRRCWRSFVSGQALGAHKRHCTWPPVEQEIVNNFDLNEVPPPEEEDSLALLPWHY